MHGRSRLSAVLLVAAIAAVAIAGCTSRADSAQPVPGRIDGAVVDGLLNPFGNTTVTLVELGRTDVTSRFGGFTFRSVPPGEYTVASASPGTNPVSQTVVVTPGRVSRVILQLLPTEPDFPHLATLRSRGVAQLPIAGGACDGCGWTTRVDERPQLVVVHARWESPPLVGGTLALRLLDDSGRVLAIVRGHSPLRAEAVAHDIPADVRSLRVDVSFGEEFVPYPGFEMESGLDLYYDYLPGR